MSSYSFLANVEVEYLVCAEVIVKAVFPNSPFIVDMIINRWYQSIVLQANCTGFTTVIPFFSIAMARCPRLSLRLAQLAATLVAALLLASSVGGSDKATYYTPESDDLSGLVFAQATLWLSALWAAVDMLLAKVSPYRWAPLVMCRSLMDAIFSLLRA